MHLPKLFLRSRVKVRDSLGFQERTDGAQRFQKGIDRCACMVEKYAVQGGMVDFILLSWILRERKKSAP